MLGYKEIYESLFLFETNDDILFFRDAYQKRTSRNSLIIMMIIACKYSD